MRQFFKRLLLPLAVIAVTQTSIVSAESIRLKGPNGEIQSSPQFSDPLVRSNVTSNEPSRFYGPTSESETLWRIASQLRPSNAVSVQQTLLAIYRLNPQAFENQNLHTLIPQSTLRVPSLAQVSSASTQEAVNIMALHQARLDKLPVASIQPTVPKQTSVDASVPSKSVAPVVQPALPETPAVQTNAQKTNSALSSKAAPQEIEKLEEQLETSETELLALEQNNHKLRLMLSDVQSEVAGLKDELGDEDRIKTEVEKLLAEERQRLIKEQQLAPTVVDQLLANTWLVALLAVIPGLLLGLIIVLLMGRRNKTEMVAAAPVTQSQPQPVAPIIPTPIIDEDVDDDLLLDDDLFGESGDDDQLFGDDISLDGDEDNSDDSDIFADLDDSDLDFNLEGEDGEDPFAGIGDDGDLDADAADLEMSANGISVNADDKALSLEEMERALDEAVEESVEESEFDLSDDEAMSQDDIEALLSADGESEELSGGELDQSLLDDLFAENQPSQSASSSDSDDDFDIDSLLADNGSQFDLGDTDLASDSEIDDLFAQVEAQADLEALEQNSVDETSLLDELLGDDVSIDSESTDLLDELLDDSEDDDIDGIRLDDGDDEVDVFDELISDSIEDDNVTDENSTDLLDELIDASDDELLPEIASDDTHTLDELLGDADENEDTLSLDEDSVDLLDELLDSESTQNELTDFGLEPSSDEQAHPSVSNNSDLEGESLIGDSINDSQSDDSAHDIDGTELFDELLEIEKQSEHQAELNELAPDSAETGLNTVSEDISDVEVIENDSTDAEALPSLEPELEQHAEDYSSVEEKAQADSLQDEPVEQEDALLEEAVIEDPQADLNSVLQEQEQEQETRDAERNEEKEFDSSDFVDDMASVAPHSDPLLDGRNNDPLDGAKSAEDEQADDWLGSTSFDSSDASDDDFSFEPKIEGSEDAPIYEDEDDDEIAQLDSLLTEDDLLAEESTLTEDALSAEEDLVENLEPNVEPIESPSERITEEPKPSVDAVANEFGIPQDDDWLIDEPEVAVDAISEVNEAELSTTDTQESELTPFIPSEVTDSISDDLTAEEPESFDESSLPEYDESDALVDIEAEPSEQQEELDTDFHLDDIELPEIEQDQPTEQQTAQVLDESTVADTSSDSDSQSEGDTDSNVESNLDQPSQDSVPEVGISDDELPTFDELDALEDLGDGLVDEEIAPNIDFSEQEYDELELPEFGEEEALAEFSNDVTSNEAEPIEQSSLSSDESFELDVEKETDSNSVSAAQSTASFAEDISEQDALFDVFQSDNLSGLNTPDYEEQNLNELLNNAGNGDEASVSFDSPVDSKVSDSAGLDIDAMLDMGGEDWNGFNLSDEQQSTISDDIPDEDKGVWQADNQPSQANVEDENWSEQDDFGSFNRNTSQYRTIDDLMAEVEQEEAAPLTPEEEALKLDVGLHEFPDVIGDIGETDVDSNAAAAGKLDLAKIYVEMNDSDGAIKLLEEAIVDGSDDIRREAKNLIDTINGKA